MRKFIEIKVETVRDVFVLTVCLVWIIANLITFVIAGLGYMSIVNLAFFLFWAVVIAADRVNGRNNAFSKWLDRAILK